MEPPVPAPEDDTEPELLDENFIEPPVLVQPI